jgi:4-diphosphocytidyl-2-C-methyl-D-erythritol kinase
MKLFSPAKINLFLAVTGRRPDGYHNLLTLMCCLEFGDRIELGARSDTRIVLSCSDPDLPDDSSNLAWQAAANFFRVAGCQAGASIAIDKRIPVGAGLGGGSSNAAVVLMGLNQLFGTPLDRAELIRIGAGIGADVPFFMMGGAALATGIGDRLEPFRGLDPLPVVVAFPGVGVSTAETFAGLNLALTKCEKKLKAFLLKNKNFDGNRHLCNDLESVTLRRYPIVAAAKRSLREAGAGGVLMTGSGSGVFGLFAEQAGAQHAVDALSRRHPDWKLVATRLRTGGAGPEVHSAPDRF